MAGGAVGVVISVGEAAAAAGDDGAQQARRDAQLLAWATDAPSSGIAHPEGSPGEHLMPFFVAYGAAGEGATARLAHKEYLGSLPMAAYEFFVRETG